MSKKNDKKTDLDKSIGRITYPADPKITNRPDQQVKTVSSPAEVNTSGAAAALRYGEKMQVPAKKLFTAESGKVKDKFRNTGYTTDGTAFNPSGKLDQMSVSHPGNSAVIEHEGAHYLFSKIYNKHGSLEANKFVDHLISHIHPKVKEHLDSSLQTIPHYAAQKNHKNESTRFSYKTEIINLLRDMNLNESGNRRKALLTHADASGFGSRNMDNKAKSSWKNVVDASADYGIDNYTKKSETSDDISNSDLMDFIGMGPLVTSSDLKKQAHLHQDQETLIDQKSHQAALSSVPSSIMNWGIEHLVPMNIDDKKEVTLNGSLVVVRKVSADLYSGWTEKGGSIGHKFERVTMPQLMSQLQSALEIYEKKPEFTEMGQVISDLTESHEADNHARIREKLETLRAKIRKEVLPIKEVLESEQEDSCPACELEVSECSCYSGLPKPIINIDIKAGKIQIMFKSEWGMEERENFKDDLKKRAKVLLQKKASNGPKK